MDSKVRRERVRESLISCSSVVESCGGAQEFDALEMVQASVIARNPCDVRSAVCNEWP